MKKIIKRSVTFFVIFLIASCGDKVKSNNEGADQKVELPNMKWRTGCKPPSPM